MSQAGRKLQPGDWALTDFSRGTTRVQIVARKTGASQSGIQFQVQPALNGCHPRDWFDADWFEPASLSNSESHGEHVAG